MASVLADIPAKIAFQLIVEAEIKEYLTHYEIRPIEPFKGCDHAFRVTCGLTGVYAEQSFCDADKVEQVAQRFSAGFLYSWKARMRVSQHLEALILQRSREIVLPYLTAPKLSGWLATRSLTSTVFDCTNPVAHPLSYYLQPLVKHLNAQVQVYKDAIAISSTDIGQLDLIGSTHRIPDYTDIPIDFGGRTWLKEFLQKPLGVCSPQEAWRALQEVNHV